MEVKTPLTPHTSPRQGIPIVLHVQGLDEGGIETKDDNTEDTCFEDSSEVTRGRYEVRITVTPTHGESRGHGGVQRVGVGVGPGWFLLPSSPLPPSTRPYALSPGSILSLQFPSPPGL